MGLELATLSPFCPHSSVRWCERKYREHHAFHRQMKHVDFRASDKNSRSQPESRSKASPPYQPGTTQSRSRYAQTDTGGKMQIRESIRHEFFASMCVRSAWGQSQSGKCRLSKGFGVSAQVHLLLGRREGSITGVGAVRMPRRARNRPRTNWQTNGFWQAQDVSPVQHFGHVLADRYLSALRMPRRIPIIVSITRRYRNRSILFT